MGNNEVTYSYAAILTETGQNATTPFIYNTETNIDGEPVPPFNYAVLRVRVKNNQRSTSVEFKNYNDALKRYFNILAADLQDEEVTFNFGAIVNSEGEIIESKVFNN